MGTEIIPSCQIDLIRQLSEINGQVLRRDGYPYDPWKLRKALQNLMDGVGVEEDLILKEGSLVVNYDDPRCPIPENKVSRSGTAVIRYVECRFDHYASPQDVIDWINGDSTLRLCCHAEIMARLDRAFAARENLSDYPIGGIFAITCDGSEHQVSVVVGNTHEVITSSHGLQERFFAGMRHFAVRVE